MKDKIPIVEIARQMLAAGFNLGEGALELKKTMIVEALRDTKGNICRAARALRMHRNTLSRNIEELKIGKEVWDRRAEARAQRALKFGGRLPVNSRAMIKLVRSQQENDRRAA